MSLTNYKDIYNDSYSKMTPSWFDVENLSKIQIFLKANNRTLCEFFDDYIQSSHLDLKLRDADILEAGCGFGGMSNHLVDKCSSVTGIDVSDLAIAGARTIAQLKEKFINYEVLDLTKASIGQNLYDFIIDSHLLHCLISNEDRAFYLKSLKNSLKDDGMIFIESMVFQPELEIPVGYELTDESILLKELNGQFKPIRRILSSLDLEEELKNNGLTIHHFYYHNELSFHVFDDYQDYPLKYLPKTLRVVLKKTS